MLLDPLCRGVWWRLGKVPRGEEDFPVHTDSIYHPCQLNSSAFPSLLQCIHKNQWFSLPTFEKFSSSKEIKLQVPQSLHTIVSHVTMKGAYVITRFIMTCECYHVYAWVNCVCEGTCVWVWKITYVIENNTNTSSWKSQQCRIIVLHSNCRTFNEFYLLYLLETCIWFCLHTMYVLEKESM